jgi:hypothetical protein
MSVTSIDFADFIAGEDRKGDEMNDDIMSETSSELRGMKRRASIGSRESFSGHRRRERHRDNEEAIESKKREILMKLDMKREMCRDIAVRQFNMGDDIDTIQHELDRVERMDSIKRAMGFIKLMTTKAVGGTELCLVHLMKQTYMRGWGVTWGAQVSSGTHDSTIMRLAIQYHSWFSDMPPWLELAGVMAVSGVNYAEVQLALSAMNDETTDGTPAADLPIPKASGMVMSGPEDIERDLQKEATALVSGGADDVIDAVVQPKKKRKKQHRNDAAVIDLF